MNVSLELIVSFSITVIGVSITIGYFKHKVEDIIEDFKEWKDTHKNGCQQLVNVEKQVGTLERRVEISESEVHTIRESLARIEAKMDVFQEIKESVKRINTRVDELQYPFKRERKSGSLPNDVV
jgi:predicted  nucleic acid-binding Zn-ribbon protein